MNSWWKMRVGNYEMRFTPIKSPIQVFPKCDGEGNILKEKEQPQKAWSDRFSKEEIFRLINGKPRAKLPRTKEVNKFIECSDNEFEDLITERFFVVDCPLLLEKLQNECISIKFPFSFGNGFKVYVAYIHTSRLYENVLFMSMGMGSKIQVIKELIGDIKNRKVFESVEMSLKGIKRATAEELMEITAK